VHSPLTIARRGDREQIHAALVGVGAVVAEQEAVPAGRVDRAGGVLRITIRCDPVQTLAVWSDGEDARPEALRVAREGDSLSAGGPIWNRRFEPRRGDGVGVASVRAHDEHPGLDPAGQESCEGDAPPARAYRGAQVDRLVPARPVGGEWVLVAPVRSHLPD